jgi:predicted dithiol-disulfide oxidoreductase (DUF899 family)
MSLPRVASQDEWLAARKALLAEEKEMTRARDALSTKRRELPMVKVDKRYVFHGPDEDVDFVHLFDGKRQLIVQHFMFDPEWDEGCPSCTAAADELCQGLIDHLRARETNFVAVSRAPIEKIERYKKAKGWTFPWVSSLDSDFNYDFNVTIDGSIAPIMWNYRTLPELVEVGMGRLLRATRLQHLPEGGRRDLSHLLGVRAGDRDARWGVLLLGHDCARATRGVGGAQGSRGQPSVGHAQLLELNFPKSS